MARIDKTESAVGVVRAANAADVSASDYDKIFGVGLNAQGRVVKGAGQSGIIGLTTWHRGIRKAGQIIDIFKLGDFVEVGLVAGTKYYADNATGVVSTTNTGTPVGFTVEADRLVIKL